jgi:predicted LPLAT superfamily acyltransferase
MSSTFPEPRAGDRADAPEWAQAPERSNALAMRMMCRFALLFGRRVSRLLLHPITLYFVLCSPAARRHSRRYLRRALGRPEQWRDGYRHVFCFASTILDRVYFLRDRHELFDLSFSGRELLESTLAEGRGAFLVGAHVGSFEALRATRHLRHARDAQGPDLNIAFVMYPDNALLINRTLAAIAPDALPRIIPLGRMDSMLAIRDWLDGGGLAGMLGDRSLAGESERAGNVSVPFLGQQAVFSDGPFRLAALLRRRIIFMAAPYTGGARYDVRFETLADFSDRSADASERERRIRAAVQAYAARLESLCREHPYNWFNFHDFWREDAA